VCGRGVGGEGGLCLLVLLTRVEPWSWRVMDRSF
jgi:hypothetical protein